MRAVLAVVALLCAAVNGFVAAPCARAPARRVAASNAQMVVEPSSIDAATQLLAGLPDPGFTPGKTVVMAVSNLLVLSTMRIQGKTMAGGFTMDKHDDMVENFGLVWLLSGASLGHAVGAGAILGLTQIGAL